MAGPALLLSSGWALVFAFFANQLVWPLEAESHASMTVADLEFGSRASPRVAMAAAWLTWLCELGTAAVTAIYCLIVLHDVRVTNSSQRWSSINWYANGFCVSEWNVGGQGVDSHGVSCVLDVIFGSFLMYLNAKRLAGAKELKGPASVPLQLAIFVSFFTVLHGLAHGILSFFGGFDAEFLDQLRPQRAPWWLALAVLLALASFLAIGPFVGYVHGVPASLCLLIHAVSMFLFVVYVPLQFAFGAVQLVLNLWICIPRLILIAPNEAKRLQDGWQVISIGVLLLMPVVFSEMMLCEAFVKDFGGHALYDSSLLLLTACYSASVWHTALPSSAKQKPC